MKIPRYTKQFFLLYSLNLLLFLAWGLFLPFVPVIVKSYGGTSRDVAFSISSFSLSFMIFQLIWSRIAYKFKNVSRVISILFLMASFLFVFYPYMLKLNIKLFILLRFIEGSIISAFFPIITSLVIEELRTETPHMEKMEMGMGIYRSAGSLGWAIGALFSGFLIPLVGLDFVFYFFSVLSFLIAFISTFVKVKYVPRRIVSFKEFFSSKLGKKFLAFCFSVFLVFISFKGLEAYLPLFITEKLKGTERDVGYAFSFKAYMEVLIMMLLPYLIARSSDVTMISIGMISYAPLYLLMSYSTSPSMIIILRIVEAIPFSLFLPISMAFIGKFAPKSKVRIYTGVFGFFTDWGLSVVIAPLLTYYLISLCGYTTAFQILGMISLFGGLILLLTFMSNIYYIRGKIKI